jgi:hypothetical protein
MNKQSIRVGAPSPLSIPPPLVPVFPLKMQLFRVGLLSKLLIPVPMFPLKVQLVNLGLLSRLDIPAPKLAELPEKTQSVRVGLLFILYIPPPSEDAKFA